MDARLLYLVQWSENVGPDRVAVRVEGDIAGDLSLTLDDDGDGRGNNLALGVAQARAVSSQAVVLETEAPSHAPLPGAAAVHGLEVHCPGGEHLYGADVTLGRGDAILHRNRVDRAPPCRHAAPERLMPRGRSRRAVDILPPMYE